jgi:hypothetical protein
MSSAVQNLCIAIGLKPITCSLSMESLKKLSLWKVRFKMLFPLLYWGAHPYEKYISLDGNYISKLVF